jgi:uncharacterized membrane protein
VNCKRSLYSPTNNIERVAVGGLFLTLALALPPLFHLFGAGSVFLPMLLPVVTAGFLLDPRTAATVGGVAPLLSALLTGMPPIMPPVAFMMVIELSVLALLPSILYRRFGMNIYVVLVLTLIVNRVMVLILRFLVAEMFHIPGMVYGMAVAFSGFPGMAIQVIVVPLVVRSIEHRYGSEQFGTQKRNV